MRSLVGIFGFTCGMIVIGLVGRYGYKSTDIEADAWIMAFLFAAIAAGGLFGHAVAARLWHHSKVTALAMGVVAAVALLLNLSNSLGAIAGRSDHAAMERVSKNRDVRAAEAELRRLTGLQDAMPRFLHVDLAAATAAKRAADAATAAREAECARRGTLCRDREADERKALADLSTATSNKAATDRAIRLEADAGVQRRRLAELGPVVTVNVQGSAMAKLFRLKDDEADFAATAQQLGIAIVVELIIIMCLVAWEILGVDHGERVAKISKTAPVASPSSPAPVLPRLQLTPPPPKLASSRTEPPAGPVAKIMTDELEPARAQRVEIREAYMRYVDACKLQGAAAVTPDQFLDAMAKFCKSVGIKTKINGETLYLMGVQLQAAHVRIEGRSILR